MKKVSDYENINIDTFEGAIPRGHDLTVYEKGTDPTETGCVLYGFDEVGLYDHTYKKPQYCFYCFDDNYKGVV